MPQVCAFSSEWSVRWYLLVGLKLSTFSSSKSSNCTLSCIKRLLFVYMYMITSACKQAGVVRICHTNRTVRWEKNVTPASSHIHVILFSQLCESEGKGEKNGEGGGREGAGVIIRWNEHSINLCLTIDEYEWECEAVPFDMVVLLSLLGIYYATTLDYSPSLHPSLPPFCSPVPMCMLVCVCLCVFVYLYWETTMWGLVYMYI